MCIAWTAADERFCCNLFTSKTPQSHLHSEDDGERREVRLGASWQRGMSCSLRLWVESIACTFKGNERDLTTLELAGITLRQNYNEWERLWPECVCVRHWFDVGAFIKIGRTSWISIVYFEFDSSVWRKIFFCRCDSLDWEVCSYQWHSFCSVAWQLKLGLYFDSHISFPLLSDEQLCHFQCPQ